MRLARLGPAGAEIPIVVVGRARQAFEQAVR
jgi:hypothetical protein